MPKKIKKLNGLEWLILFIGGSTLGVLGCSTYALSKTDNPHFYQFILAVVVLAFITFFVMFEFLERVKDKE